MSHVAIVILNYNGQRYLAECLDSVARLTVPAEVVVADNGSTDYSPGWVRAHYPNVRVLDLGRNWGFAQGYNRALAQLTQTRAEWYVLLNNDAALAPSWLAELLAFAEREPQAVILGGKLLFGGLPPNAPPIVQSAGASFTTAGSAFEIGWGQPDTGQFDQPQRVGAIPGAALLIKRQEFHALGGFDARYFAYLEDVDLCWRAWLRGYSVHYVPSALAHHHYGGSGGGRASAFRIHLMQRNRLANMVKHLAPAALVQGLGVSLLYDAYRMLEYPARGQWAAWRALGAGTVTFWRELPYWLAQRAQSQRTRTVSDQALFAAGALVSALTAFREYRRLGQVQLPQQGA